MLKDSDCTHDYLVVTTAGHYFSHSKGVVLANSAWLVIWAVCDALSGLVICRMLQQCLNWNFIKLIEFLALRMGQVFKTFPQNTWILILLSAYYPQDLAKRVCPRSWAKGSSRLYLIDGTPFTSWLAVPRMTLIPLTEILSPGQTWITQAIFLLFYRRNPYVF